ncbi:DUF493 domain-containing protein [Helicobacter burdigaliensis]|uniref:HP0495 family protein n=1 Tax=Helicobacter burdigaliensis TaxID=2315334 RepID=UPI000EF6BB0D|nr:DUF493 domain-containing protein [Helicobacter burdigaliensis]
MKKPQITYPCLWQYKIIGNDKEELIEIAFNLIDKDFKHTLGKASKGGKYHSINIEVLVDNEEERDLIFSKFSSHEKIHIVI